MENIPFMGMSPMRGGGFEEVLSDGDELAASTVSSAPAPVVEYDAAPNVACQAHAAPAPVVENAPAPKKAYRAHAAPAPEVTPAQDVAYREHAAAAPVVTPAPAMMDKFIEKLDEPYEPEDDESVCGKWASEKGEVEYIASAAAGYAGPAPNEEKYFISMTRLEEVRGCKRSCGRSGDVSWRVCQWEPAPRKRQRASGICNPP